LPGDIARAVGSLTERGRGVDVRWFPRVSSTMDVVAAWADQGAPHGLVVGADEQTAGRGRRGHGWSSPPGAGLYFSMLARPRRPTALVTLAAGVAVRRGIERVSGLAAELEWPNDLMAGSRKLAGILSEAVHVGVPETAVVIGVGINLAPGAHPPTVTTRATSIAEEGGGAVDRGLVLAAVIEELIDVLASLDRGRRDDILREWRLFAPRALGSTVEWDTAIGVAHGVTAGVDDEGALLVDAAHGRDRIVGGDVRWLAAR
jgi:BirA family biotin operon repressor/biotin-[acetyl-CoA-carboxylase] ligase